ncbi:tRNA pseudouridine(55) synthase TruB [Actinotalea sp. K2]|uniref:tRNA pseudouridine(55) synthase TruB n=1 Tax=Actinotalea sp. K2 TaxID=2939438 RepID=UPI002017350A|nr:tRNA pseudouridine(55) synthase TruB [Actinotalea sp. K2]MCL3860200.1 tRNA pseudouridine(55) synthase TruB [Actinotalea sp. K2]
MADRVPAGLVVVDKPAGWTSHDVVARVRRLAGTRKVGHAGTLDPMATGVLVLGVEAATRLLTFVVGADKDYAATIRLGVVTTTDDAEGEVLARAGAELPLPGLADAVARLTGPIDQVPSTVSAIKVDGRRAYARARAGEVVELAARRVTVDRLLVRDVRAASDEGTPVVDVDVEVTCSSGTYVRALARDLGSDLGTGGHLTALRRTRVGGYGLDVARSLDELAQELALLPLADAARATLASREVDAEQARELTFGRRIPISVEGPVGTRERPVAAFAPDGTLVALVADEQGRSRPVIVFASPDDAP